MTEDKVSLPNQPFFLIPLIFLSFFGQKQLIYFLHVPIHLLKNGRVGWCISGLGGYDER